jgi:LysR family carnitine catabolism transcriptional activator
VDVRKLSLFLAVVEHGSFTKAAAAAYLSQPGLSKAVAELEQEVGARLFDRVGHGLRLTASGEALVAPARQVLRDIATAETAVAAVARLEKGSVVVGCLPTLAADPMAAVIGAFRREHPGVQVNLAAPEDAADLLSMVRNGTVEVAVTETRLPQAGLVGQHLGPQELVAILPPGSSPPRNRLSLRRLAQFPLVVTPRGTSSRRVLDEALAAAGIELAVAVETAQREAVLPLVLAGAGAALVPTPVAAMAARHDAVVAPLSPPLARSITLLSRDAPLSPAAKKFRAVAVAVAATVPRGKPGIPSGV